MSCQFQPVLFCLCLLSFVCFSAVPVAAQCPPRTTVSDTMYNADGSLAAGRVVIAWSTFSIGPCQVVAGQATVTVAAGALSVQLYPNDAATPSGTSYRVTYYLQSGKVSTEYWVVPTSATPVMLATVRSPTVPVPTVMFSQAQVTNLMTDLARKVELPSPCPAGKFLQSSGSATPPQVACVDGAGAPLASSTQSGTVKTDVSDADPRVYLKASTDTLLAGKAAVAHTHAATDTTSGVFEPARIPTPSATSLGGIKSGSCNGADKVTGVSTAGAITCATDQTGSGSQHQVNGTNFSANDPVNFQDSPTVAFSNPSAGNIQASVKDASITAAKLSVSSPSAAQLSGIGDTNIAAGALSPNRISGTAEVQSNKGAATGYPSLNASAKVVQDPANAQTTPAATKIPLADGAGKIADGWLSSNVSLLGASVELATEVTGTLNETSGGTNQSTYTQGDMLYAPSANTLTKRPIGAAGRYLRSTGTVPDWSSVAAGGAGPCTNQFVRAANDNAAPTCASVAGTDFANQSANQIFAGPSSGGAAAPAFRAMVKADTPATTVHTDQANTYSGGGLQDFSANKVGLPAATTLPGTCTANKEIFVDTDAAPAGQQVYLCNSTGNGWNLIGDGGAGGSSHEILSATHTDTTAASVARGAGMFGMGATPKWTLVNTTTTNRYFKRNSSGDIVESSLAAAGVGTPTACSNQFVTGFTLNADTAPTSTCTTATLASAQFANQGTTTTVLHGNAAGNPSFAAVSLTTDVSGILGSANGGTGNGFTKFSGPATSEKTFTLPNASATVLTDNAAVTVAQGGTGASTVTTARSNLGVRYGLNGFTTAGTGVVADAQTLYVGHTESLTFTTFNNASSIIVPVAGTVERFCVTANVNGTLASPQAVTFVLRKNDTTDTAQSVTQTWNTANPGPTCVNVTTTFTVAGDDRLALKVTTPTWTTNPSDVKVFWTARILQNQ